MSLTQSDIVTISCCLFASTLVLFLEWPRFRTRWSESGSSILRFVGVALFFWFIGFACLQVYAARHAIAPYLHYLYRAVGTVLVVLFLAWHERFISGVLSPGTTRHKKGIRGGYVLAFTAIVFIWDGTFYHLNHP